MWGNMDYFVCDETDNKSDGKYAIPSDMLVVTMSLNERLSTLPTGRPLPIACTTDSYRLLTQERSHKVHRQKCSS